MNLFRKILYSNEENVVVVNEIEVEVGNECTSKSSEIMPMVGMKFENYNKIFEFYKKYVYSVDFSVRKKKVQENVMLDC